MRRVRTALALGIGALLAAAAPAAAQECDPFGPAEFRGQVPTPKQVIGIDLGERDVTTAESDRYVQAVDGASERVVSGTLARTVQGRDLRYAIVGEPDRVSQTGLAGVRASAAKLMDPATPAAEARAIAERDPAILWIAGNVHGGEESGADASLQVLWELADRADCAASRILDAAVVVLLPVQNPDGREADTRQNAYGFDMNRDWFARTQPETDGKVEMLRRYPPVLFVDAHEMGGENDYFFPPNADPIYHETTSESVSWINDIYGAANRREFDERGLPYFNYDVYDLFYQGYGDTVPTTGFGAAGMTYEKTNRDAASVRVAQQYLTQWNSLSEAAAAKARILAGWHDAWVEAERQGAAGELEPNEVVQPDNTVQQPVPDITVRQYFIRDRDRAKRDELQALVRRLQRMDVEVRRLARDATVEDYTPYGRATRRQRLRRGDYVVSMDQRQKHWVQAMLNEDTYTPFPYFYDVTAWSQPLLFNVDGGYSGAALRGVRTEPVQPVAAARSARAGGRAPSIALYSMSPQFSRGIESSGWLRFQLDQWGLDHRDVSAEQIKAGALRGADVLLVPDGYATEDPDLPEDPYALRDLGPEGLQAIRDWVSRGGRYVGWMDGAVVASAAGASSATFESAEAAGVSSPGALIRAAVARRSPLAEDVGRFAYPFYESRYLMRDNGAPAPVRYPAFGTEDFFVSGYADGEAALSRTAAVVDERVGRGRTVAFGFEPNFRAFTTGTQHLLLNAILGRDPRGGRRGDRSRVSARTSARRLRSAHAPVRLVVAARGAPAARALLRSRGLRYRAVGSPGRVAFSIANPGGASGDEAPWTRELAGALQRGRVPVVMYRVP